LFESDSQVSFGLVGNLFISCIVSIRILPWYLEYKAMLRTIGVA
jgi:hypothetical protein